MELSPLSSRAPVRRSPARPSSSPVPGAAIDPGPGRAARKVGAARRLAIYSTVRRRRLSRTDLLRHGVAFAVALVVHALVALGVLAFFAALPPPGERVSDPRGLVVSLEEPAAGATAAPAGGGAGSGAGGEAAGAAPGPGGRTGAPNEADPNRFADPDQLARDIDAQARPVVPPPPAPGSPPATPAGGSLAAAAGLAPASAVNTKGMNRGDYYALVNERLARAMAGASTPGQLARVVPVRFTIGTSGQIVGTWLLGSSGDPRVDQRALALLRAAGPFPPIPASVGSDRLDMTYRVSVSG